MSGDDFEADVPTRRELLTTSGAVLAGATLAGCTTDGATETAGTGGGGTDDGTTGSGDGSTDTPTVPYEACIEPVGCRTYEAIPEEYVLYNGAWADMAFALGQRDGFLTGGNIIPAFLFEPFGIDAPTESDLTSLWADGGWDKEAFYDLDPDVFLIDPEFLEAGWDESWDDSDTQEIVDNVAPFFGNNCRRRREFHDYKLYSLYGAFERAAQLFQQQDRYEALASVHEDLQAEISSRLPSETPTVGLINGGSDPSKGEFYPLDPQSEGYEMKPYRDLNVQSAFPDSIEGGSIDYEQLLEVDPDIILVHWGIGVTGETDSFSAAAFHDYYVAPMEEDEVGSQLTAVENGAVYPGQYGEQGPLVNLLQTEMVAQQLYPEEFGEFAPEQFPAVPEDRRLFDRQRVRDIVAGDI